MNCVPRFVFMNNIQFIYSVSLCLWSRWVSAMRTETTKRSYLPTAARTADGPVSAAPTRSVAWRDDAAGDIRSRTAEATLLPQHHPAARTLTQAASCPSVANVSKTSVKGEAGWGGQRKMEKWKIFKRRKETLSLLPFYLELGLILVLKASARRVCFDAVYCNPWEVPATKKKSQIIPGFYGVLLCFTGNSLTDCKCCIMFQSWRDASVLSRAKAENLII